jgi:hypothetical protein
MWDTESTLPLDAEKLYALSAELRQIAEIMAPSRPQEGISASFVRSILRARRLRDQYFTGQLFADPAWDMMLDLLAARLEDRRVSISSLGLAAAVPPTTALRWIATLCDRGAFVRSNDSSD